MKEAEIAEQFRLFQQAIVLAGEAVETLKRDQRAAIAALRLDVEVLKRCLFHIPPNLVVAPRASHNTLDLSMRYPHHVFLRANGI